MIEKNFTLISFILSCILTTVCPAILSIALSCKFVILGIIIYLIFISIIDIVVVKKKFAKDSWVDYYKEFQYFVSAMILLVTTLVVGLVNLDLSFTILILPSLVAYLQMTHFIAKHLNSF